jgi:hypothetical protein
MLSFVFVLISVASAATCPKISFAGYQLQKSANGEHRYFNSSNGLTLIATCFSSKTTFEQVVEDLKKEGAARNTNSEAVYFEFKHRRTYKRVYVLPGQPVRQFTFSIKSRKPVALDGTQLLIEQTFKKTTPGH